MIACAEAWNTGNLLFDLLELLRVEALVPADVDQHLDAAVEFQQRLRRR